MKTLFIISSLFLLSISLMAQHTIPKTWQTLEVNVTRDDGSRFIDTTYVPGEDSDTVRIAVSVELLIAPSGLIKSAKVFRSHVTDMENRNLNKVAVSDYENKALQLYKNMIEEKVIFRRATNKEYKMRESASFYVPAQLIYKD